MYEHRLQLAALIGLAAVLFFANTWGYDLWPADEPRFGEVPREMMQSGNYLVPHCNGEPYKEKPPLLFWAIAAVSWPFGDVSEFTARAPSGIAAILTLLFTYLLAARLYGRRIAVWSVLILMTMSFFWWEARSVRTDMLLTACMTGSLLAFWRWHETRQSRYLLAFYAGLMFGLLTKGPPALAFPLLLAFAFYWRRKDDRRRLHWILGTLACMAPVLVWFLAARMSLPATPTADTRTAMGRELFNQIIGRLFLGVSKAQPPWYYLFNIPAGMLPWTLFLPWALPWVWKRRRENDRMRLLLAWTIPAFIFFSISVGKRGVYLLPIYPTLAILTARAVLDLVDFADGKRVRWRKWTAVAWGVALIGLGAAPFGLLFSPYRDHWSLLFLIFSVLAVLLGLDTLRRLSRTDLRMLHATVTGHFAVLALFSALFLFPAINDLKGASSFCRPLRELSLAKTEYRLYSIAFSREEYVFYSRHFHKDVLTDFLPVTTGKNIDPNRGAGMQRRIRSAMTKAVENLSVESLASPNEPELDRLRAAIDKAVAGTKVDPEYAGAYEAALQEAVMHLAGDLDQSSPVFAFVQEEDWKWLLTLLPEPGAFAVIAREGVGQRQMLLIANHAGAALAADRVH